MNEPTPLRICFAILDRCLRNESREYSVDDLLKECNIGLDIAGYHKICKKSLYNDLRKLQEPPYNASIKKWKSGHYTIYRYQNTKCSMPYLHFNKEDAGAVRKTIDILSQLEGVPQYDWVRYILEQFEINEYVSCVGNVVSFQNNDLLIGKEHFIPLLGFILNKQPISIVYKAYYWDPEHINVHPYHLKQYNNRWFLLAYDERRGAISNFPLDRIEKIKSLKKEYIESNVVFEEYFEDIIGVTLYEDEPLQEIKFKMNSKRFKYLETKPIHGTQRVIHAESTEEFKVFSINVKWNRELEALILSYGKDIEVLEPMDRRNKMKLTIQEMMKKYQ